MIYGLLLLTLNLFVALVGRTRLAGTHQIDRQ